MNVEIVGYVLILLNIWRKKNDEKIRSTFLQNFSLYTGGKKMRQTTIRSFNLDWEVAHALRYKKKNQSAYVNRVLREKLLDGLTPMAISDVSELGLTCFLRDKVQDEFLKQILQRHADHLISLNDD